MDVTVLETELCNALFVDPKNGKFVDELSWVELAHEEKRTVSEEARFDIDFIAVSGSVQQILNSMSVVRLLGHGSCKFFSSCSLQIARCSSFKRMLVYAKCGDFLFGEPVGQAEHAIDEETVNDGETIEFKLTETHRTQVTIV